MAAGPAAPPVAVDDGITEDDEVEDPDVSVELRMVLDEDEDDTDVNEDMVTDEEVGVAEVTVEVVIAVDGTDVVGVALVVTEVVIEGVAVVEGGATVVVVCGVGTGRITVAGSDVPPKLYNVPNGI